MEEREQRRLRIKWTPNLNKKFNEAIRRLGEKATAIPILEYMNVPQLKRKQVENRLQQYRVQKRQAQLAQHASSSLLLGNHPNVLNSHEPYELQHTTSRIILTPNTCNTFISSTK
ncbi:LOW QUALITY PROTEIN: putative two-component response regulator ARR20 [Solanum verrucosum]|uniref:LOW QUALITY PROTEIN: putative two-component response regulator ARR20 n=1 Tax=Solanum verrucosum TaxID=315347 RepID=UPI0020D1DB53|nr:LOW QUALITY PROTEIN: putative two-component response regulator ARR20 [Solanum verrucosum]